MSYGYTPVPARELGADLVLDDFAQLPAALQKLKLLDFPDRRRRAWLRHFMALDTCRLTRSSSRSGWKGLTI